MARLSLEPDSTITDDRPLAVRRKRRCSSVLIDPLHEPKIEPSDDFSTIHPEPAKTPSKPKKKVRFSDPGPDMAGPSSSTGLTPALSRASFAAFRPQPTSFSNSHTLRRVSLPDLRVATLPSPSLSPSPGPLSGEIQFMPLHQRLDDRVKRRLRRNHLSEESNEIEAEKKSRTQYKQEIQQLKAELASAKKQQMYGETDGESSASRGMNKVQALEQELLHLKQEIQDQESITSHHTVEGLGNQPPTPTSIIFVDDNSEDLVKINTDAHGVLKDQVSTADPPQYAEVSTQASIQHPREVESLRSARLSLEYMFPGEIALGLVPEDPKPLLDALLERLQMFKARALIAEDSLSITQTQESNLRSQFNAVLEQLDRARKYAEKASKKHNSEKARADAVETKAEALEVNVRDASTRVQLLVKSIDEKDRSNHKLQEALDTYRAEVGKLEILITRIESDHNATTTKLRAENDEAVADLECHVTAEIVGRREAEQQVEQQDQRIKELRVRENELTAAINEKQHIIRNAEEAFNRQRHSFDRSIGTLNAQVSQLKHNVRVSDKRYEQADRMREVLTRKLEEEKQAGLRAVAAVQAELAQCSRNADGIREAHVSDSKKRGVDVLEHKGLLTPTTGGRFRDGDGIEGFDGSVEVQRGKKGKRRKRPDSGVVLEEDEDEVMTHF